MARSSAIGQFCPLSHQQFSKGCSSMSHLTAQTQAFSSTSSSTFPPLALHPATMQPPGCPLVYVTERQGEQLPLRSAQVIGFYTWDAMGLHNWVCRGATSPWLRKNIKSPPRVRNPKPTSFPGIYTAQEASLGKSQPRSIKKQTGDRS